MDNHFDGHVRSIATLNADEIRTLARRQAERGEPCVHNYTKGSREAVTWERNHAAVRIELEAGDDLLAA